MTQIYNEDVIINDNLQVNGSSDEVQVIVKGYSGQSEALQQWQDSSANVLLEVDEEGHLLVGDPDATIDSLIESHNLDDSNKPSRGFHAKGSLTGTLSAIVSWVVQELVLKGTGGISALHRALRVQATNENTGAMASGADVRAGDFEAINSGGNSGTNNLEISAIRAKVDNQSGAYLDKAYGLKVEMTDDGNSNEVYAIHTDSGTVHLGDLLELVEGTPNIDPPSGMAWIYPKSDGNLYARFHNGSTGQEKNLSSGGTVDSVFGRTGAVVSATSDYDASQIDNDSSVSGATVKDALDALHSMSTISTFTYTRGESISSDALIYLNENDLKWYQVDIDSSPPRVSKWLAISLDSGIVDSTGTAQSVGTYSGLSALSVGERVWATDTPGAITQTKPTLSLGGAQKALMNVGLAVSTTDVNLDLNSPKIRYLKADTLAPGETLEVEHHGDIAPYLRNLFAYFAYNYISSIVAQYAVGNYDSDKIKLQGAADTIGETISYTASGTSEPIGDNGGTEYQQAQSFTPTVGGILSQLTFYLSGISGSPSGGIDWAICSDSSGYPSTELITGNIASPSSGNNTISIPEDQKFYLSPSTMYWLKLSTQAQASNNRYNWRRGTGNSYAGGYSRESTNGGSSWSSTQDDCQISVTIQATSGGEKLVQILAIDGSYIDSCMLYLRKYGSPTGTLSIRLETVSAGNPSGTLAHANATASYSEASLSTSFAEVELDFADAFNLPPGTYALVLQTDRSQSNANYLSWGAGGAGSGYSGGNAKSYNGSSWDDESKDFIFALNQSDLTFDVPALIVDWESDTEGIQARYGDTNGDNADTITTFRNNYAGTIDLATIVEF